MTALRQQILSLNVDHTDIAQLQQIEKMSKELIRSLNVVVENYPELKADTLYSKMMDDIQEQNEMLALQSAFLTATSKYLITRLKCFQII